MEGESEVVIGRTNKMDGRRKPEEIGQKKNAWQTISPTKRPLLELSTRFFLCLLDRASS